ncbi:MAG: hypothetical protein U0002_12405 [Thermoanaerobaculia bacterium]
MKTMTALLVLGLAASAAQALSKNEESALSAQLAVEEKLTTESLKAYQLAREEERKALESFSTSATELDQALGRAETKLEDLEKLGRDREIAQAAVAVVRERVARSLNALLGHRQQIAVLREVLANGRKLAVEDAISGRWRVEVAAPADQGTFELRLAGSAVTGTYKLGSGKSGSLRGTYVGGRLRLERVDKDHGLDGTFEGNVDPLLGTARGFFSPAELGAGGPAGAGWSAVRLSSPEPEKPQAEKKSEEGSKP